MLQIVHTTIGAHRETARFWTEGPRLAAAGFAPGTRFTVKADPSNRRLRLEASPSGERLVSSRKRPGSETSRPIIDITGALVESLFAEGARVQLRLASGVIEVTLAPLEAACQEREGRVRSKLATGQPLAVGSICGGAGVIDHGIHTGLHAAGIQTVAALAMDIDPAGLDVTAITNPATRGVGVSVEGSLEEADPASLPVLDLLVATLPCTAASLSGRAHGKHSLPEADPDVGHLVVSALSIVRATNPAAVIVENVPPYATTASAALLRTTLSRFGYRTFEVELYGPDHGALERRRRWALVAVSTGLAPEIFGIQPGEGTPLTVADILEDVDPADARWMDGSYLDAHASRHGEAGNGFSRNFVQPSDTSVGVIGAGYHKHRTTEPHLQHPENPALHRLLTPTEHARAKALPGDLSAAITNDRASSVAHRLLGQSGCWPCWEAVGRALGGVFQAAGTKVVPLRVIKPAKPVQLALAV